ncbi:hypothetical protein LTR37_014353 [Vermiconidia calcicola]|uniref:Uncharacterized protein n=1 Tax=Vermiconidia calcicola TaxID=1690605 RepID=A0ACC3MU34_9PEZI|nr:hypothetical protein LTR37_014353 [Vermiconidia calcicola]
MEAEAEILGIPPCAQHATDVNLPANAAERKRVLNILAQRRYRRRRRERQAALETLVSHSAGKSSTTPSSTSQPRSDLNTGSESPGFNTCNSSSDSVVPNESSWQCWDSSIWTSASMETDPELTTLIADPAWTSSALSGMHDFLQNDDVQNTTFADDYNIVVPELDLLRAAYQIAGRLQSSHLLFAGLDAQSVFHSSSCGQWMNTLPTNLQPTTTQLTVPHHPIIDILPWPAVRTRLIRMYNLPSDLWPRHPSDGTESSLVRMVYDMEDGGIRVTGSDPSKESAWEVEQRFFEVWWWALDHSIISNSNRKRSIRGLPRLYAPSSAAPIIC